MTDPRSKLHQVDGVPVPDLMDEVVARAAQAITERDAPAAPRNVVMRQLLAGAAATVLVLAGVLVVTAVNGGQRTFGSKQRGVSWLTDSGGKCAESFSVGALADVSWAFDGTIVSIVPPRNSESEVPQDTVTQVTFRVDHWYRGGSEDTVTRKTYGGTDDPNTSLGARVLASGKGDYIWGCGFSLPYTEQNAKTFGEVFG